MCEAEAGHYFRRMVEQVGARWGLGDTSGWLPRQKRSRFPPVIKRTYGRRLLVLGDAGRPGQTHDRRGDLLQSFERTDRRGRAVLGSVVARRAR